MNDNNEKSNTLLLTVIAVATLLVAVIGATFAYFTANTTGGESASTLTVTAATLTITFADGNGSTVTADTNIEPTATALITKNFTLTPSNNTDKDMPYTLNLVVTENNFVLQNAITTTSLSYRLTNNSSITGQISSTANDTYIPIPATRAATTAETNKIPAGNNNYDQVQSGTLGNITIYKNDGTPTSVKGLEIGKGEFKAGNTNAHSYTLEIFFKDDGKNQDVDKNKTFAAYIDLSTGNQAIK